MGNNGNSPASTYCSPVSEFLNELHARYRVVLDGKVATYIPELAKADPNWFGICMVTTGGGIYEVGDSRQEFTIQSISKPFVYGMALEDNGRADVLKKVGVEPSGDAFNAISLDRITGRPFNPMINAGAIATTGLIAGKLPQTRQNRILETFGLYAGRDLVIDGDVYRSERETGHRNRAIGHMLRNFNMLVGDPDPVVDLYFKQCSILVNCRDLAVMAATLANHGLNPVTGKQAIRGEYVESVLSVMGSCGTYDFAGEWIYKIGMPAKSGVAGGIIAVLPGQLGIGIFSPRLDERGNSVRGIGVCEELSRHFDLHLFNPPTTSDSIIRTRFTAAEINSSRLRTEIENTILREAGSGIHVYELQGKLVFATAEVVARVVTSHIERIDSIILDFHRVTSLNESACRLFFSLVEQLGEMGKPVVFANAAGAPLLRRYLKVKLGSRFTEFAHLFQDVDLALEWCENRLLRERLPSFSSDSAISLEAHELMQGLSERDLAVVRKLVVRRTYAKGEVIISAGDVAAEVFCLARGVVSVKLELPSGRLKRLATLSSGMTFGEMAVIDGARRSAMVIADTEVECDLLRVEDFNRLMETNPGIKIVMLKNLNLALCRKLRKADRELTNLVQ